MSPIGVIRRLRRSAGGGEEVLTAENWVVLAVERGGVG